MNSCRLMCEKYIFVLVLHYYHAYPLVLRWPRKPPIDSQIPSYQILTECNSQFINPYQVPGTVYGRIRFFCLRVKEARTSTFYPEFQTSCVVDTFSLCIELGNTSSVCLKTKQTCLVDTGTYLEMVSMLYSYTHHEGSS